MLLLCAIFFLNVKGFSKIKRIFSMRRTTRNLFSMTFLSKTTRLMALIPPATVYMCFRVYEKPPPPDGDRRQKGFVNLHRFLLACASRFPRFFRTRTLFLGILLHRHGQELDQTVRTVCD